MHGAYHWPSIRFGQYVSALRYSTIKLVNINTYTRRHAPRSCGTDPVRVCLIVTSWIPISLVECFPNTGLLFGGKADPFDIHTLTSNAQYDCDREYSSKRIWSRICIKIPSLILLSLYFIHFHIICQRAQNHINTTNKPIYPAQNVIITTTTTTTTNNTMQPQKNVYSPTTSMTTISWPRAKRQSRA